MKNISGTYGHTADTAMAGQYSKSKSPPRAGVIEILEDLKRKD
uniref:Uncharacterized protein n=1 Tax=Pseudomonas fluorescens (strain SBW25) TaxID=216595 RepID=A0A0G4E4T3_PSEFS|nr:hypothetical protein PQBR57_0292 [Pseudomonas fluorescens SBW25]